MAKTVILSCPTLKGELTSALAEASSEAIVYFMPQRLHSDPKELHDYMQDMIDRMRRRHERTESLHGGAGGAPDKGLPGYPAVWG